MTPQLLWALLIVIALVAAPLAIAVVTTLRTGEVR
jgi:hypothetical protein